MPDWLNEFTSGRYAPHGYCLLWQPGLVWTHVVSDALIALSYFSIPIALISLVRRRPEIEFGGMFWLFALFILACGSTHIMAIWNLWHGDYALEAVIKAITAAASVPTALLIWPLIPRALALPSPTQLQAANADLALMVSERDGALLRLGEEAAQREAAEAALTQAKKMEAVGQLTGGIAHDFNNLLQAVAGNLDLISRRPDDAERVARWAGNAAAVVDRGARLTGQLLAFSRTQRLEARAVDASALVTGMDALLRQSVGPTIQLETLTPVGLRAVLADPTQLELAILNLAINARDAMPQGGSLSITVEPAGDTIAIRVRDTGAGMSPEIAERATEPFFTTKAAGEGTGLGLSMAFGVARQAGGDLTIATATGEGTTISLLLPAVDPVAAAPVLDAARPASLDGCRLLLVDDDDAVRSALAEQLREAGGACEEVNSGDAALTVIAKQLPDILVVDYAMPGMTGAQLATKVRVIAPVLPILFVTGYADSAAIDAVTDTHSATLKKPFSAAELTAAIVGLRR